MPKYGQDGKGYVANPQIARMRDMASKQQKAPAPKPKPGEEQVDITPSGPALKVETHHPDSPENPTPGKYTTVAHHGDGPGEPESYDTLEEAQQAENAAFDEGQSDQDDREGAEEEAEQQPQEVIERGGY